jgi:hypothetical protein
MSSIGNATVPSPTIFRSALTTPQEASAAVVFRQQRHCDEQDSEQSDECQKAKKDDFDNFYDG